MNPNDEIRRKILQYFYDCNASATSQYGKRGSAKKISDVKRDLKAQESLSQQQVVSNLTYLIDKGWINRLEMEKTVQVKGGTIPSRTTWYEISAEGVDKIEGDSEFRANPKYAGVNINATGANIITLGDGNVVNSEYSDLHAALGTLRKELTEAATINDDQKLNMIVDVDAIRDQLVKSEPDRTLIRHLWNGIKDAATVAGLVGTIAKTGELIKAFLT